MFRKIKWFDHILNSLINRDYYWCISSSYILLYQQIVWLLKDEMKNKNIFHQLVQFLLNSKSVWQLLYWKFNFLFISFMLCGYINDCLQSYFSPDKKNPLNSVIGWVFKINTDKRIFITNISPFTYSCYSKILYTILKLTFSIKSFQIVIIQNLFPQSCCIDFLFNRIEELRNM